MTTSILRDNNNVLDDVNDLEAEFGYYRPLMDEAEAGVAAGTERPRRGRPPKDPSAAMSDVQKADRMAVIMEAIERMREKQS